MVYDPNLTTHLPDGVTAVLRTLDEATSAPTEAERDNFAFNVLINALSTVLERIRITQPEQFSAYREMAQLMLKDDH